MICKWCLPHLHSFFYNPDTFQKFIIKNVYTRLTWVRVPSARAREHQNMILIICMIRLATLRLVKTEHISIYDFGCLRKSRLHSFMSVFSVLHLAKAYFLPSRQIRVLDSNAVTKQHQLLFMGARPSALRYPPVPERHRERANVSLSASRPL